MHEDDQTADRRGEPRRIKEITENNKNKHYQNLNLHEDLQEIK
jgi:hypothetical protein